LKFYQTLTRLTMRFLPVIILSALLIPGCSPDTEKIPEKPNFLFIAVDDLRPELNCYGADWIRSPQIDRLAASGIRFEYAYCQVPVCGASRASLLTGLRPTATRFIDYDTWAEKDAPGIKSLPAYLKENGYVTISNGKVFHHLNDMKESWTEDPWHPAMELPGQSNWRNYRNTENLRIANDHQGAGPAFERMEGDDTLYFDGMIARKSLGDLERFKSMDQPFFLAVGFLKPHLPFNAPAKYWDQYDRDDIRLASNNLPPENAPAASLHNWGELRQYAGIPPAGPLSDTLAGQLIHGYYACVSYTDAQIGKLFDKLEELGLAENTVIVLWGDHGWNLGEHGLWCKHCNYETSLRAPLLLRVPWIRGNVQTRALVEFVDIYPTFCELAGLPIPSHAMGESLLKYFHEPENPGKEFVYSRFYAGESIKNADFRYTEWLDTARNRYAEMLYDHRNDPDENINIAIQPGSGALIEKFQNSNEELRQELMK
jgi:iduronate 2-sulfatase